MTDKKSTIYGLAELAGVSASTVSSVLNGSWRERRIGEETALKIQKLAAKHKFNVNRQASGLRTSRSGLIGMIIPLYDNRFFSSMAQVFERLARARGWYPIVVSTLRDPELELETVRTLISYRVEHLLVAGATDPDSVSRICRGHGIAHVNVDLPGTMAPSVISDNHWGAQQLTRHLIERSRPARTRLRNRAYFIGGIATDHATQRRMQGFADTVAEHFGELAPEQINACGYEGELAEQAVRKLYQEISGLPRLLFINSTIALEGVVRFLTTLPTEELERCAFGCYDWDPFAAYLSFPLPMVRQNVEGLLEEAFRIVDQNGKAMARVTEIRPQLMFSSDDRPLAARSVEPGT